MSLNLSKFYAFLAFFIMIFAGCATAKNSALTAPFLFSFVVIFCLGLNFTANYILSYRFFGITE